MPHRWRRQCLSEALNLADFSALLTWHVDRRKCYQLTSTVASFITLSVHLCLQQVSRVIESRAVRLRQPRLVPKCTCRSDPISSNFILSRNEHDKHSQTLILHRQLKDTTTITTSVFPGKPGSAGSPRVLHRHLFQKRTSDD